jgi:hypothetical protein
MPRKSPFFIKLTRRERAELVRRSGKYQSAYRDVIRAKIVLLASKGLANDAIGARLDTPRQIVKQVASAFSHPPTIRSRRPAARRPTGAFSPPVSGWKSKRWLVNLGNKDGQNTNGHEQPRTNAAVHPADNRYVALLENENLFLRDSPPSGDARTVARCAGGAPQRRQNRRVDDMR